MKRRIRMFLPVLVTLAMVVSVVSMAIPVSASQITVTKDVTTPSAVNIYYVGDTIYYQMSVANPSQNAQTNNLTRIWDTSPDGNVTDFLYAGSPYGAYLVQQPGNETIFYANYTILANNVTWLSGPGYYGVKNIFQAQGIDSARDSVNGYTEKSSRVIRPSINITKTVDFNGDGVYTDLEANRAGQNASWNVTVCNNGFDPVYDINVTDTNGHGFGPAFNLSVGECKSFVYPEVINAPKVNNATAVGYDDLGNPVGPVSDTAEVVVVDARISVAPNATNPVGMAHNFTVTVEKDEGEGWVPADGVSVNASLTGVGSIISTPPYTTNSSGQVTVTVNSSEPGIANLHASAAVNVTGVNIDVDTDGYGAFVVDNEKTWVDARISIAPNATNPVGMAHNFTVTVEKTDDGTNWDPVVGINVTPNLTGVGAIISSPPYTTDGSGQVTVTVNSSVPGVAHVNASASVPVGSGFINVDTDGYGAFVVDNEKTWGDARISIASNATNPVGMAHNFTVTVEKDEGSGWVPADGVSVNASLTGVGSIISSPPYTTDSSGQVTVTVNSSVPGTAYVDASASVPVGGGFINVDTDGYGAFVVDNEKDWVDARISIAESATNPVGVPHTFNVTVEMNDGGGWGPAGGVNVTPWLVGGSVGSIISSPPYITDGSGMVFVTVNSSTPGTATVEASATVNVGGIDIAVATDGYGAYYVSNVKTWEGGGNATRTWGFWKTHLDLVEYMYPAIWSSIDMGTWNDADNITQTHVINSTCMYFGLMWSDQSKNSDKDARYAIDVARIHLAHQALAAITNSLMPGGAPLPAGITPALIAATLSSNNITAIGNLASLLDTYNQSGDGVALDPSLQPYQGNGDPNGGKTIGANCKPKFDTPPAPKGKGHK